MSVNTEINLSYLSIQNENDCFYLFEMELIVSIYAKFISIQLLNKKIPLDKVYVD